MYVGVIETIVRRACAGIQTAKLNILNQFKLTFWENEVARYIFVFLQLGAEWDGGWMGDILDYGII